MIGQHTSFDVGHAGLHIWEQCLDNGYLLFTCRLPGFEVCDGNATYISCESVGLLVRRPCMMGTSEAKSVGGVLTAVEWSRLVQCDGGSYSSGNQGLKLSFQSLIYRPDFVCLNFLLIYSCVESVPRDRHEASKHPRRRATC